jgi:hypothetical protein
MAAILYFVIYYVIRPLLIIGLIALSVWAIILGVQFWIDLTGPPLSESVEILKSPQSAINIVLFVPNRIQPNYTYEFEAEVSPSVQTTQPMTVSITLLENSSFISTDTTEVAITQATSTVKNPDIGRIHVRTRNLRFPPSSVVFTPQIMISDQVLPGTQPFVVIVDA